MNLNHSPADIVARALVLLEAASDPERKQDWPAYATVEPTQPDNCITVKNTAGTVHGRTSPDKEINEHFGFQVRVRCADEATGWAKANALREALKQVLSLSVAADSSTYTLYCVVKFGSIMQLGRDAPNSERRLFTFNAQAAIKETT